MNRNTNKSDAHSAKIIADHIPSIPNNKGINITADVSNISVREKDMQADIMPLFKAVKNAEAQIFIPAKRKDKE